MAKNNNLTDFLTDIADAIREKKGTTEAINPQDFSNEIASIQGGGVTINNQEKTVYITQNGTASVTPDSGFHGLEKVVIEANIASSTGRTYTGHADVEGLKAIGWTEEDIAYYQANGVNWNEEYDEYHKVTDDNKALYGVLTADNISKYKDRIVYLPKIDTGGKTYMASMFTECRSLVAIPYIDTFSADTMYGMFSRCYSLVSVPPMNTINVTSMKMMFSECRSLVAIPQIDTSSVTTMASMFSGCISLVSVPSMNTESVTSMESMFSGCGSLTVAPMLNTENVNSMFRMFYNCESLVTIPDYNTTNVTNMAQMFWGCCSLKYIPQLDTTNVTDMSSMFYMCYSLKDVSLPNTANVIYRYNMFNQCFSLVSIQLDMMKAYSDSMAFFYSLTHANIKNNKTDISFSISPLLSKESLLYLINNEASTSAFTVTLHSYAYDKWSVDDDIVTALEAHPNVSLIKA